ncbi:MAG: hypothetical protein ACHQ4F_14615 [Candidatus Dormibacteria bacterium]
MTSAVEVPALAVGDPDRRRLGMATVMALWTAAAFVLYLWVAKEVRPLYLHEPWQDDPYDAVVSFAFFFVPLLAALCVVRAALCKRAQPLPLRRARELLIASRLMLGIAAATLAAEWISFALGVHRQDWSLTTVVVVAALGVLTAAVLAAGAFVIAALRRTPAAERGPDWWSDMSAVVAEYWHPGLPLGRVLPPVMNKVIDRLAWATRSWPIAVAAAVSVVFGGLLATSQGLAENGFAPPVFSLYMSVAAASMFAFLLAAGAHLQLAGARPPPAGRARRLTDSLAAAAAAFAAALAFRVVLEPVARFVPGHGIGHLLGACALMALAAGVLVFLGETGLNLHSERQISGA